MHRDRIRHAPDGDILALFVLFHALDADAVKKVPQVVAGRVLTQAGTDDAEDQREDHQQDRGHIQSLMVFHRPFLPFAYRRITLVGRTMGAGPRAHFGCACRYAVFVSSWMESCSAPSAPSTSQPVRSSAAAAITTANTAIRSAHGGYYFRPGCRSIEASQSFTSSLGSGIHFCFYMLLICNDYNGKSRACQ